MSTLVINRYSPDIWTFADLLTPGECQTLIQKGEGLGFAAATVRMRGGPQMLTGVRNNDRAEWTDAEYARALWERVRSLVPAEIDGRTATGLFDHFRFYRYNVGQRFKRHIDGSVTTDDKTQKSRLTFLLYLNEGYEGGETIFDKSSAASDRAGQNVAPPLVIVPQTGMGLFFVHERKHEGAELVNGRKYVLRTDVLYSV